MIAPGIWVIFCCSCCCGCKGLCQARWTTAFGTPVYCLFKVIQGPDFARMFQSFQSSSPWVYTQSLDPGQCTLPFIRPSWPDVHLEGYLVMLTLVASKDFLQHLRTKMKRKPTARGSELAKLCMWFSTGIPRQQDIKTRQAEMCWNPISFFFLKSWLSFKKVQNEMSRALFRGVLDHQGW